MQTLASSATRKLNAAVLVMFVTALALPSILAAHVSAATAPERSIQMSTSQISATGVSYTISFNIPTPVTNTSLGAVVIDFDGASPVIGDSASPITGLAVGTTSPTAAAGNDVGGTWTGSTVDSTTGLRLEANTAQTVAAGDTFSYTVSGFTNPSSANTTFYARIVTYDATSGGTGYTASSPGTYVDSGGVALVATNPIQVSATVAETLQFCVSAADPGANCAGTTTPSITLGHGSPVRLDSSAADESTVYYQVSTNAANATNIRIKGTSGNLTSGSNTIPAHAAGGTPTVINAGTAAFGFRTAFTTAALGSINPDDVYESTSTDFANMVSADVTSTFGDVIGASSGVIDDAEATLTFVASAASTTAAGTYTASYNLIATPSY